MKERPKAASSARNDIHDRNVSEKKERPNSASTTLGVPAITSTADSTARASGAGRPYSTSQSATQTPIGTAIAIPIVVSISVPWIGSRKPPVWLWSTSELGWVHSIAGLSCVIPLKHM